jgi:hypothetical protein
MPATLRVVIAFGLSLWIAIAPALLAGPAFAMPAQMAAQASASDHGGSGDCDCCPHPVAVDRCLSACLNALAAALVPESIPLAFFAADGRRLREPLDTMSGWRPAPDPPPPKRLILAA